MLRIPIALEAVAAAFGKYLCVNVASNAQAAFVVSAVRWYLIINYSIQIYSRHMALLVLLLFAGFGAVDELGWRWCLIESRLHIVMEPISSELSALISCQQI
jgi:hypothetical protein